MSKTLSCISLACFKTWLKKQFGNKIAFSQTPYSPFHMEIKTKSKSGKLKIVHTAFEKYFSVENDW